MFSPAEKQAIINSAGQHGRGEDYTTYTIRTNCPITVKASPDTHEPLGHFIPEGLLGHPAARQQFNRFYSDAVFLWKHDKEADAAVIPGRALHLVEDMAQPQHAKGEAHLILADVVDAGRLEIQAIQSQLS